MASVVVLNGRNKGEWYSIGRNRPLVVGRSEELLAEVLDRWMSHQHFQIGYDEDRDVYWLEDLGSRNGTKVNGERVRPRGDLSEEDVIRAGHTVMVFTRVTFESPEDGQVFFDSHRERQAKTIARLDESTENLGMKPAGRTKQNLFKRFVQKRRG